MDAKQLQTPDTLPWIPPGQPKEDTFNKFAHKKGSIASKINAEVASKKSTISSPKKKISSSSSFLSKGSNDSGRGSQNSETFSNDGKENLKEKILEIFEEEENDYIQDGDVKIRFVDSNFDSGVGSLDHSSKHHSKKANKDKKSKKDKRNKKDKTNDQSEYTDEDTESDGDYEDKEKLAKRSVGFKNKMTDYLRKEGKFQRMEDVQTPDVPNTAEMRGYESMRKDLDGDAYDKLRGNPHDRDLNSRNSLEFYDDDFDDRLYNSYRSYHKQSKKNSFSNSPRRHDNNRNSFRNLESSFVSPRTNLSESFNSRRSNLDTVPEAWLVFPNDRVPKNGALIGDQRELNNPTSMSYNRAVPVNLRQSIGSRLQASFTNINQTTRETPVEQLSNDKEKLTPKEKEASNRRRAALIWGCLICIGLVVLVASIVGIAYAIIGSSGSSSSALVNSGLTKGPGDNSPCEDYITLTESWRRITGLGPSQTGEGFNCDKTLREAWYRFEGDAGTQLADIRDPPKWEECGTSKVAWLQGDHPTLSDGTVNRTICVTEFEGDCHFKMNGQVRTCPSSDNKGETFFVYFLIQPSVGCHWAYCAYNEEDVDVEPS